MNPKKVIADIFMFTTGNVKSVFTDSEEPNFNKVEPLTEKII